MYVCMYKFVPMIHRHACRVTCTRAYLRKFMSVSGVSVLPRIFLLELPIHKQAHIMHACMSARVRVCPFEFIYIHL